MSRFFSLMMMVLLSLAMLPSDTSAAPNNTCLYEYNAVAGNFLVYKYKNNVLTYTYATDRLPRSCEPVPAPTVTLTWVRSDFTIGYCGALVTVTHFPDGEYLVEGLGYWEPVSTVTGGTGAVSSASERYFVPGDVWAATVNGALSEPSVVDCRLAS